jgi:hypothetical protein
VVCVVLGSMSSRGCLFSKLKDNHKDNLTFYHLLVFCFDRNYQESTYLVIASPSNEVPRSVSCLMDLRVYCIGGGERFSLSRVDVPQGSIALARHQMWGICPHGSCDFRRQQATNALELLRPL